MNEQDQLRAAQAALAVAARGPKMQIVVTLSAQGAVGLTVEGTANDAYGVIGLLETAKSMVLRKMAEATSSLVVP